MRPIGGIGPHVTTDSQRASGYAVRACCIEVYENPDADPTALVIEIEIDADHATLIADDIHDGDYLLRGGVGQEAIVDLHTYDASEWIGPRDPEKYARLAAKARELERDWQATRFGLD